MPTMIIGAAVSVGVGLVSQAMMKKPTVQAPISAAPSVGINQARDPGSTIQPRDFSIKQALPARRRIYGDVVTGGFYFYHEIANPYLYMGVLLGDGVIDNITHIIIEGRQFSLASDTGGTASAKYPATTLTVEKGRGAATQARSPILLAADNTLPITFRQAGVARAVLKMFYGNNAEDHADLWGSGTDPVFRVRGVRVYDPRAVGQSLADAGTWTYSTNAALCIYDFLRNAWAGKVNANDIDTASVMAAANVCDTPIPVLGEVAAQYQISGIASADRPIGETLADMLSACGGTLIYSDGKFKLYADQARSPLMTITDNDVTGSFSFVNAASIEENVNVAQATFYDSELSGQPSSSPVVALDAATITEDGRQKSVTYDFPFTPSDKIAARLAFMRMMRARAGRTITLPVSDVGTFLDPMDVVTLQFENASFLNGNYEVVGNALADIGCVLTLREYPEDAYLSPDDYL